LSLKISLQALKSIMTSVSVTSVYRQRSGNFLLKSEGPGSWGLLLRERGQDFREFSEQDIPLYLESGIKKFLVKLKALSSTSPDLSSHDEKELRFMLEALVYAKQTLSKKFPKHPY
jgi:hypothetical protein